MTKKLNILFVLTIIALAFMYYVEAFWQPGFLLKSISKLTSFGLAIAVYYQLTREEFALFGFSQINKKSLKYILTLAVAVFLLTLLGYALIKNLIDLDNIKDNLLRKEKITKETFPYVALYISFVNSFLEELFFRGFLFGNMKSLGKRKLGYLISPLLFALYHIAIIDSWFSTPVFILMTVGLFGVGVFFNYLYEKANSFIGPWIVHILANFAINTVGFIMLGII